MLNMCVPLPARSTTQLTRVIRKVVIYAAVPSFPIVTACLSRQLAEGESTSAYHVGSDHYAKKDKSRIRYHDFARHQIILNKLTLFNRVNPLGSRPSNEAADCIKVLSQMACSNSTYLNIW